MTRFRIKENFQWMAAPEFQIVDTGKNTVTIKGVAVRKGQVSRNKRKYVGEELHAAARTFIGKPVTINHAPWDKSHPMYDGRKVPGHIEWMEFENDQMEYRAKITKQPYVDLVRSKSVEIKGVSIEADYLYNRCAHCGDRFYTPEDFKNHMIDEHFIKNFNYEPRGMLGRALSLVLSPEEPGVPGTSVELMEKYQRPKFQGFSQLLETISQYKQKEKTTMKKPKTTKEAKKTVPYDHKHLVEQEEVPSEEPCSEGKHRDSETGECVDDEPEQTAEVTEQDETIPLEAPVTTDAGTETPTAVTDPTPVEEPEALPAALNCGDGFHLEDGGCVPDEEVVAQEPEPEEPPATPDVSTVTVEVVTPKIVLPPILKLGEPYAGYDSFDDCVAKNADKDDPNAYCADIKRKTEGETVKEAAPSKDVYERINLLYDASKSQYCKSVERDVKLAEAVNMVNRALAKVAKEFPPIGVAMKTPLKELAMQTQQGWKHLSAELAKVTKEHQSLREHTDKKLGQLATEHAKTRNQTAMDTRKLIGEQQAIHNKALTLATQERRRLEETQRSLKEAIDLKTKDFEKILAVADKNAEDLLDHNKTLESRVKELEAEQSAKAKSVKEASDLTVRLDNLERQVKQHAEFKGKSKPIETAESGGREELGEKTPYSQQ